jgi:hypothetical protein
MLVCEEEEEIDWIFKDDEDDWFAFLILDLSFVIFDLVLSLLAEILYFDYFG